MLLFVLALQPPETKALNMRPSLLQADGRGSNGGGEVGRREVGTAPVIYKRQEDAAKHTLKRGRALHSPDPRRRGVLHDLGCARPNRARPTGIEGKGVPAGAAFFFPLMQGE